ncbi:hypothetical protein CKO12_09520 [Chromatium okenii]|uniref:Cas10/Cmr2 second palm domain-containing protein n=1 Tax=Chromatium okenii TaxID=61644 RepID=UPI0019087C1E|nr:hypothetical protein [Chromatium okenii]MBK1642110.1 hypothetical protein [Chromatium okenii]
MTHYACLFEAKSIQEYILRSGRLRHIVGASELIDSLTGAMLDNVFRELKVKEAVNGEVRCSRRAGGAIYLFTDDQNKRDAFRDLWALVVRQYAPGLSFIMANGEGKNDFEAYQAAKKQLETMRNRQPPALPAGTPVTRYSSRTGLPASSRHSKLGLQDAASEQFGQDVFWKRGSLVQRFAPDSKSTDWPRELEYDPDGELGSVEFPFLPDNRYLGLLHADGNGLGQVLINLTAYIKQHPENFIAVFRDFSNAIQTATTAAANAATVAVLTKARTPHINSNDGVYPARPIVLGGDDLTLLIRADLALKFTEEFLTAFEVKTEEQLKELRKRYPQITALPEKLTAGAGIAFVKSSHPFYMTMELTEGLAKFAKNCAKDCAKQHKTNEHQPNERIPPTVAFYRVTTASHGDYRDVREQELTFCGDPHPIVTSLGAYGVDPQPFGLPALADVQALAKVFAKEDVARGPARQLLTLIGQDVDDARRRYARWRDVMKNRAPATLNDIDDLLTKLCGKLKDDLPVSDAINKDNAHITPLADLATLLTLGKTPTPPADQSQETRNA